MQLEQDEDWVNLRSKENALLYILMSKMLARLWESLIMKLDFVTELWPLMPATSKHIDKHSHQHTQVNGVCTEGILQQFFFSLVSTSYSHSQVITFCHTPEMSHTDAQGSLCKVWQTLCQKVFLTCGEQSHIGKVIIKIMLLVKVIAKT